MVIVYCYAVSLIRTQSVIQFTVKIVIIMYINHSLLVCEVHTGIRQNFSQHLRAYAQNTLSWLQQLILMCSIKGLSSRFAAHKPLVVLVLVNERQLGRHLGMYIVNQRLQCQPTVAVSTNGCSVNNHRLTVISCVGSNWGGGVLYCIGSAVTPPWIALAATWSCLKVICDLLPSLLRTISVLSVQKYSLIHI